MYIQRVLGKKQKNTSLRTLQKEKYVMDPLLRDSSR